MTKVFLLLLCSLLFIIKCVNCAGLNEEFTWTRISYFQSSSPIITDTNINNDTITFPENKRDRRSIDNEEYIYRK